MRNWEIDFDFEEGAGCGRTRDFRGGDDCFAVSGKQESRIVGVEQIFTPEREARIREHCKRIQTELKRRIR